MGGLKIVGLMLLFVPAMAQADCRNSAVKRQFDLEQGYTQGRKGFVVDHVCPLACGGIDATINMQYQSKAASKSKDRWERKAYGCKKLCNFKNSKSKRTVFNCKGKNYRGERYNEDKIVTVVE